MIYGTPGFIYSSDHNVYGLKSFSDYKDCKLDEPYVKYFSGGDLITFLYSGTYYYACGAYGHCEYGMKVTVIVR